MHAQTHHNPSGVRSAKRASTKYDLTAVAATPLWCSGHHSATTAPLAAVAFLPLGEVPWWLLAGLTILILAATFAGGFLLGVREGHDAGALGRKVHLTQLRSALRVARGVAVGLRQRKTASAWLTRDLEALERSLLQAWHAALDLSEPYAGRLNPPPEESPSSTLGVASMRDAL